MAVKKIRFHCGCGFATTKQTEAVKHVDSTSHTLDVLGRVLPEPPTKEQHSKEAISGIQANAGNNKDTQQIFFRPTRLL